MANETPLYNALLQNAADCGGFDLNNVGDLNAAGIYQTSGATNNYIENQTVFGPTNSVAGGALITARGYATATSGTAYNYAMSGGVGTTSASTATIGHVYITGNTTTSTAGTLSGATWNGLHVNIGHSLASTPLTAMRNIYSYLVHTAGAGAIGQVYGIDAYMDVSAGAGTVTDLYELYLRSYIPSGTVTGNQWGIYQQNSRSSNYLNGKVGLRDATNIAAVDALLWAYESSSTATSGSTWAFNGQREHNPASASSGLHRGGEFQANVASGNAQNFTGSTIGVYGQSDHKGSGTNAYVSGGRFRAVKTGTGVVSDAIGISAAIVNTNVTGSITNAYGIYIDPFVATGTITNRWGIYQSGASESNYFAGSSSFNSDVDVAGKLTGDIPRAELYQDDTGSTTTMTLIETWYSIGGTWTASGYEYSATVTAANGRITPTTSGIYKITYHISGTANANNQDLNGGVLKNGAIVVSSQAEKMWLSSGETHGVSGSCLVSLNGTTDYVNLGILNTTSAGKVFTVDHVTITISRVGNL